MKVVYVEDLSDLSESEDDGEEESVEEESESETEMVEEIEKEGEIVPGTSYVNAELEMERMFFLNDLLLLFLLCS